MLQAEVADRRSKHAQRRVPGRGLEGSLCPLPQTGKLYVSDEGGSGFPQALGPSQLCSRLRKSFMVRPGSALKRSASTRNPSIRSSRKVRKSILSSHQPASSQTGPKYARDSGQTVLSDAFPVAFWYLKCTFSCLRGPCRRAAMSNEITSM